MHRKRAICSSNCSVSVQRPIVQVEDDQAAQVSDIWRCRRVVRHTHIHSRRTRRKVQQNASSTESVGYMGPMGSAKCRLEYRHICWSTDAYRVGHCAVVSRRLPTGLSCMFNTVKRFIRTTTIYFRGTSASTTTTLRLDNDATGKLCKRWQGSTTDYWKLQYSYLVDMGDGRVHHIHANKIRKFNVRVQSCNIIN